MDGTPVFGCGDESEESTIEGPTLQQLRFSGAWEKPAQLRRQTVETVAIGALAFDANRQPECLGTRRISVKQPSRLETGAIDIATLQIDLGEVVHRYRIARI